MSMITAKYITFNAAELVTISKLSRQNGINNILDDSIRLRFKNREEHVDIVFVSEQERDYYLNEILYKISSQEIEPYVNNVVAEPTQ